MIATLSQSLSMPAMSNRPVISRSSNSAGGPLPLVPRRSAASRTNAGSSSTILTPSGNSFSPVASPSDVSSHSNQVVDDHSSSDSSSSSDAYLSIRPKRVGGIRRPSENNQNGPTIPISKKDRAESRRHSFQGTLSPRNQDSAVSNATALLSPSPPKVYQPGSLKLTLENLKPRAVSHPDAVTYGLQTSHSAPLQAPPPLIRKKSGEPLRSSLKGSKARVRGSLSVVTDGMSSKSAPATPSTSKGVQFDSQLEHVKLFFAEQKPIAVSRDGSPTDDTSGTDSDFPGWIYGDSSSGTKAQLIMTLVNKPSTLEMSADVVLEDVSLASRSTDIIGRVRVRNIAFQKWIAVRFTLDAWQTTSEVAAKYLDSPNSQFDRFSFAIKLSNLLARIEDKTLELAVRYSAAGREMWDNNRGQNYIATFTKKPPIPRLPSDDDANSPLFPAFSDLRNRLEKVAAENEPPSFASLPSLSSLKSRYDFGASLKDPWKSPEISPSPSSHSRTQTHPGSTIPFPTSSPSVTSPPPKRTDNLPSPREFPDTSLSLDSHRSLSEPRQTSRNHQRGYFDLKILDSSAVRRTPPGSLSETPFLSPRHHSFPPLHGEALSAPPAGNGNFPAQIPPRLIRTESESSTCSSSSLSTPIAASPVPGSPKEETSVAGGLDYKQFLTRFCFFTGSLPTEDIEDAGTPVTRCPSLSSVEELLSTPRSTSGPFVHESPLPHRSSSLDTISPSPRSSGYRSGSVTPTPRARTQSPIQQTPSVLTAAS